MAQQHLSRLWFLSKGCKQVPLDAAKGQVRWGHPNGYFLKSDGLKATDNFNPAKQRGTTGSCYPCLRECGGLNCHIAMALAFYGERPVFKNEKTGKPYVGICHHLIPDKRNYRPDNLLCWLNHEQHNEADRRQRLLRTVVPDGDLTIFTYERLRDLQDPRSMSREIFEQELAAIKDQHFTKSDPHEIMLYDMTHHMEC